MRKTLAGLAAIGVIATCALPNGASADGALVLKRNAVAKRPFDFEGKHIGVGLVLRSPGKGIVGTRGSGALITSMRSRGPTTPSAARSSPRSARAR